MSEFLTCSMKITSKEDVIEMLNQLGLPHEVHEEAQNLKGYQGDTREQKAEIIVRRANIGSSSNDVGFKWNEEKGEYDVIISAFDKPTVEGALRQTHAALKIQKLAKGTKKKSKITSGSVPSQLRAARQPLVIEVTI